MSLAPYYITLGSIKSVTAPVSVSSHVWVGEEGVAGTLTLSLSINYAQKHPQGKGRS